MFIIFIKLNLVYDSFEEVRKWAALFLSWDPTYPNIF